MSERDDAQGGGHRCNANWLLARRYMICLGCGRVERWGKPLIHKGKKP